MDWLTMCVRPNRLIDCGPILGPPFVDLEAHDAPRLYQVD